MSVLLNVDGVNDDCSKGNDINFIFKGFFVSGQVYIINWIIIMLQENFLNPML